MSITKYQQQKYDAIPMGYHTSKADTIEFTKEFLLNNEGRIFRERLKDYVIYLSPNTEHIRYVLSDLQERFPLMDLTDCIRAVAKGYTTRPRCITEGCNHWTKFSIKGFKEKCNDQCCANTVKYGIELESDHCLMCGKPTKNKPFCDKHCSWHYFEFIAPYIQPIKESIANGDSSHQIVLSHGFSDNYVIKKHLFTERASIILGTRAFMEVMAEAEDIYSQSDSPAIWAVIHEMGERPTCTLEGCNNHIHFPRAPSTEWRGKYCSPECGGEANKDQLTTTEIDPEAIMILNDEDLLTSMYHDNGDKLYKLFDKIPCSGGIIRSYLEKYGVEIKRWKRSFCEHYVKEILDKHNIRYQENYRPDWLIPNGYERRCEIDFFLPDHNIGIELNGEYWHSIKRKKYQEQYHYEKYKLCRDHNINLLQLYQMELEDREEFWGNYIISRCTGVEVITSDLLTIDNITHDDAVAFYEANSPELKATSHNLKFCYGEDIILVVSVENDTVVNFSSKMGTRVDGWCCRLFLEYPETIGYIKTNNDKLIGCELLEEGMSEKNIIITPFWANTKTHQYSDKEMEGNAWCKIFPAGQTVWE